MRGDDEMSNPPSKTMSQISAGNDVADLLKISHSPAMKATLSTPKASGTQARSKLILSGTARRMTREQILAEDATFLALMRGGRKAAKSSVKLVREGRQ